MNAQLRDFLERAEKVCDEADASCAQLKTAAFGRASDGFLFSLTLDLQVPAQNKSAFLAAE